MHWEMGKKQSEVWKTNTEDNEVLPQKQATWASNDCYID